MRNEPVVSAKSEITLKQAEDMLAQIGVTIKKPKPRLTFKKFQEINWERANIWHKDKPWSAAEWYTAFMGEGGEIGNLIKKLLRIRDGVEPTKADPEDLHREIKYELADAAIYLFCLASHMNVDLEEAITTKFNYISERWSFDIFIGEYGPKEKVAVQELADFVKAVNDNKGLGIQEDEIHSSPSEVEAESAPDHDKAADGWEKMKLLNALQQEMKKQKSLRRTDWNGGVDACINILTQCKKGKWKFQQRMKEGKST